jgi:hypothetical protein
MEARIPKLSRTFVLAPAISEFGSGPRIIRFSTPWHNEPYRAV